MKQKNKIFIQRFLFIFLIVFLWQLASFFNLWTYWLFPSPFSVAKTLYYGFFYGDYLSGIIMSLKRLFIGFGFSIVIGSLVGVLLAKFKLLQNTLGFIIMGLQTLPSLCWLPLAILWFGLNESAIIFVVVMGSVLSIAISVNGAIRKLQPELINTGKMLGATGLNSYFYVIIPLILPSYITSIKHGWSFAWRSLISGEMLFVTVGLGQLLMFGRELNDISQVIAVMIITVIIGVLFDQLFFGNFEKSLNKKWGTIG